jgi:hypothetical protein
MRGSSVRIKSMYGICDNDLMIIKTEEVAHHDELRNASQVGG